MTGHLLRSKQTPETKTAWLFVGGNLLLFAGVVMDIWLPINKKLWTSSYSVFMAGMAMNCFAVCYWLVDVQGWRKWAKPFAIYGMNAIAVFMLAGLSGRILPAIKVTNAAGRKVGLQTTYTTSLRALRQPRHGAVLRLPGQPEERLADVGDHVRGGAVPRRLRDVSAEVVPEVLIRNGPGASPRGICVGGNDWLRRSW